MKYTVGGLLKEMTEFAEEQIKTVSDMLKELKDERVHDVEQRIINAAIFLVMGNMRYKKGLDYLKDITEIMQAREEKRDGKTLEEKLKPKPEDKDENH